MTMRLPSASPMLLAFFGVALLCCLDAGIKLATQSHPVISVTFMRYAMGALIAAPFFAFYAAVPLSFNLLRAHALRGVAVACSAFLFFYGLSVISIAETIAIGFIAPLLVPPIARVLIGERMRPVNVIACCIGFAGVLVTVTGDTGPASAGRAEGIVAVFGSAVLYAVSIVLLRQLAVKDDAHTISLLATLLPALFVAPFALVAAPLPEAGAMPLFAAIAAFGNGGMFLLARAYARAEAQQLAVFEFTALGWAALLGWWLFDEGVRIEVWIGAAIVASACLMSVWAERRVSSAA